MLEALKSVKQNLKGRFPKSLQQLKQWKQILKDAEPVVAWPGYVEGALNRLNAKLKKAHTTDASFASKTAQMINALQNTHLLTSRFAHYLKNTQLEGQKKAIVDKFMQDHNALLRAISDNQRQLSLKEISKINLDLASVLKDAFSDPVAKAMVSPRPAKATTPSVQNNEPKAKGFQFLDALSDLFKGLADPNPQAATQSFMGVMIQFVVGIMGNFFKAFLGKEAAPKVDEMVNNAGIAIQRMMQQQPVVVPQRTEPESPSRARGPAVATGASSLPGYSHHREKEKEKEMERDDNTPRFSDSDRFTLLEDEEFSPPPFSRPSVTP